MKKKNHHHCVLAGGQSLLIILLFCSYTLITATEKKICPGDGPRLLDNGFDLEVNLEHPSLICSQEEQREIGEIIQSGIQTASKRIYEWETRWKKTFGSASICPVPQNNSTRRRLGSSHHRHLVHQGFFRYYGAMRCSLCYDDIFDASTKPLGKYEVLKYDNATQTMKCHKQWLKSFSPQNFAVDGNTGKLDLVTAGTNFTFQATELNTLAELYVLQFDLRTKGDWNHQHIYVSVDGNYIDLGPFHTDHNEGMRSGSISVGTSNNNAIVEWSMSKPATDESGFFEMPNHNFVPRTMKPGRSGSVGLLTNDFVEWNSKLDWNDEVHEVNITVPRSMYANAGFLDFAVSFGGNANPALAGNIYDILQKDVIVVPAADCTTGPAQLKRYLQQDNGLVSGPVSGPIASPVSSPVSAPPRQNFQETTDQAWQGLTGQGRKKSKSSVANAGTKQNRSNKKKNKPKKNKDKKNKDKKNKEKKNKDKDKKKKKKKKKKDKKTSEAGEEDAASASGTAGDPVNFGNTNHYHDHFRLVVTSTLVTLLNDMFKTYPFAAGHCMHGVEVDVVVNIEPQPQWEDNLPQVDQVCDNATISN